MKINESSWDDFWVQPNEALPAESVQKIYATVQDELRKELEERGGSILDVMLAERAAFLYAHIRQRETATNSNGAAFANDRARKETLQLWGTMVENLQRRWQKQDLSDAEHALKKRLAGAVDDALADMDPELAKKFRELLVGAMSSHGL